MLSKLLKGSLFIGSLILSACSQPERKILEVNLSTLPVHSIYTTDSVCNFNKSLTIDKIRLEIAESYTSKAKQAEDDSIDQAIYFTKRAITVMPIKENYLYLRDLLKKASKTDELLTLHQLFTVQSTNRPKFKYAFGIPDKEMVYDYYRLKIDNHKPFSNDDFLVAKDVKISLADFKNNVLESSKTKIDPQSDEYLDLIDMYQESTYK